MKRALRLAAMLLLPAAIPAARPAGGGEALRPVTEVEEAVAACGAPGNGAGPLWCYGAPLLVRQGDAVFASVMEVGAGVPPLCNTRWRLYRRGPNRWEPVAGEAAFREREPCPLVAWGDGNLLLSVNPSTQPPGTQYGKCDPHLLRIDARNPDRPPVAIRPRWSREAHFMDHSYRGIAVDGRRGEGLVLNIDATSSAQLWAYIARDGTTIRAGELRFPIRACYPQVALRDGAAHVLAVGDVVEPREEWRAYKREKTGAAWDYVFRRLFYARTADAGREDFATPVEIDSVDDTGGHIANLDLWLDPRGAAHLLYLKTNISPILRDRFFPGRSIATTLEHVVVERGRVVHRSELARTGDRWGGLHHARFHAMADGTLLVVVSSTAPGPGGKAPLENRVLRLPADRAEPGALIDLKGPFTTFFTATERGGNRPADRLDLFGIGADSGTLRYARIRLEAPRR